MMYKFHLALLKVKFQFDAEELFANDQITYLTEHGIRSNVNFEYELSPQSRGNQAGIEVILTDHTNTSLAQFPWFICLRF